MSTTITRSEWLAEFERVMAQQCADADGMTAQELADMWGCCRAVALKRLQAMRERLVVGRRRCVGLDGKAGMVPCYRLVSPAAPHRREATTHHAKAAKRR
jgi:hypothetical protein